VQSSLVWVVRVFLYWEQVEFLLPHHRLPQIKIKIPRTGFGVLDQMNHVTAMVSMSLWDHHPVVSVAVHDLALLFVLGVLVIHQTLVVMMMVMSTAEIRQHVIVEMTVVESEVVATTNIDNVALPVVVAAQVHQEPTAMAT
jgi:hypothetical protein